MSRQYSTGPWTPAETMVLVEAKKAADAGGGPPPPAPEAAAAAMRWRWVEEYCWARGCRRSQSQCGERWDSLARDFRAVRAHELTSSGHGGGPSYWRLGRAERRQRSLPPDLPLEVYEAMGEALLEPQGAMQPSPLAAQILPRVLDYGSSGEEEQHGMKHSNSPEKKRRRRWPGSSSRRRNRARTRRAGQEQHGGLKSSVWECARILSGAVQASEEGEERRHREVVAMEERRQRVRLQRWEVGEQCMAGLATAMDQLASSVLALTSASAAPGEGPTAPK